MRKQEEREGGRERKVEGEREREFGRDLYIIISILILLLHR